MKGVGGARQQARLQLEAQLHYKLGDFAAAISLYGELFRNHKARHAAGRPVVASLMALLTAPLMAPLMGLLYPF